METDQVRAKKRRREFDTEIVTAKKFKAEEVIPEIRQNVFRYDDDQDQFEELFKAIKASQIAQLFETPTCIITEMAIYATGYTHVCEASYCTEVVVHLCEDEESFYCRMCAVDARLSVAERAKIHCDDYEVPPDCNICAFCKGEIELDDCDPDQFGYRGDEITRRDLSGCSVQCQTCRRRFCGDCAYHVEEYDYSSNYCEECRQEMGEKVYINPTSGHD